MSHHGEDPSAMLRVFEQLYGPKPDLGATGEFPRGKLTNDDEGEIKIGIAADPAKGVVLIDFGKSTAWIGFTPEQAVSIGNLLIEKSWECRGIEAK